MQFQPQTHSIAVLQCDKGCPEATRQWGSMTASDTQRDGTGLMAFNRDHPRPVPCLSTKGGTVFAEGNATWRRKTGHMLHLLENRDFAITWPGLRLSLTAGRPGAEPSGARASSRGLDHILRGQPVKLLKISSTDSSSSFSGGLSITTTQTKNKTGIFLGLRRWGLWPPREHALQGGSVNHCFLLNICEMGIIHHFIS